MPDPASSVLPILLVEDDPDSQEAMKCLLEMDGYSVVTASDGDEALTKLRSGLTPSLILLDLMTGGHDGFRFRKRQREDPRIASIPIVVCSGHHDPAKFDDLLRAAAYLKKPVDADLLRDAIEAHRLKP